MNEQKWKAYCQFMAAAQSQSQQEMNLAHVQAANAATNMPEWFKGAANRMRNMVPPLVVTDRVWNEDIW